MLLNKLNIKVYILISRDLDTTSRSGHRLTQMDARCIESLMNCCITHRMVKVSSELGSFTKPLQEAASKMNLAENKRATAPVCFLLSDQAFIRQ